MVRTKNLHPCRNLEIAVCKRALAKFPPLLQSNPVDDEGSLLTDVSLMGEKLFFLGQPRLGRAEVPEEYAAAYALPLKWQYTSAGKNEKDESIYQPHRKYVKSKHFRGDCLGRFNVTREQINKFYTLTRQRTAKRQQKGGPNLLLNSVARVIIKSISCRI